MTPRHHLDEATLLRYASGDLDEAFTVVAASHIALCSQCAQAARDAAEFGGHALDAASPAALSAGSFETLMDKIEAAPHAQVTRGAIYLPGQGDVPVPLGRYIGPQLQDVSWKAVAPGVRMHSIALAGKARTGQSLYLLHIAPGKAVPEHGHGGGEMTLVLSGAYNDALGRFARGDVADLDEDVEHQPEVEPGAPCICLVATQAPTRFKGLFSRLLQPFVGI